ncbi:hypothetical protein F5Y06DRAFT_299345 [Hypoxylon sp. FL0890]|nr:hypothetical protein F5Y06DRAFT_299345 [Hypoxylon sp. FL0890]
MPCKNGAMDGKYGKQKSFTGSKASKPSSTIHSDYAKLAETARDSRYSHLFEDYPAYEGEASSAWQSKNHAREEPPSDGGDSGDDADNTFNNDWVEKSFDRRTGRQAAQKENSDKLMETVNDPRYAHLFSHLRRPGSNPGPNETTTTGPAKTTPKKTTKTQPALKRGVNYFVIDDSDSDERPRKRFGKRPTPENSDDTGTDSDAYREVKGIRKFKF